MSRRLVGLALVAGAALGACSSPGAVPDYDDDLYVAAVCTDGQGYRVPDTYCPIGDGIVNAGYGWSYLPYTADTTTVVVPLVGYPVDQRRYTRTLPARVPSLNIDRGSFPERAATGQTAAAATVGTAAARRATNGTSAARPATSTVSRGGLGVGATSYSAATAAPRATPAEPKSRPIAPAKPRKSK
jgi:hypothetical protein